MFLIVKSAVIFCPLATVMLKEVVISMRFPHHHHHREDISRAPITLLPVRPQDLLLDVDWAICQHARLYWKRPILQSQQKLITLLGCLLTSENVGRGARCFTPSENSWSGTRSILTSENLS